MAKQVAFAVHAHPDDIEFMMGGTLLLLGQAGYELHYMNVANGSCGSLVDDYDTNVAKRLHEARAAAEELGAVFHGPLVNDIDIFYDKGTLARLTAVVREVKPSILLAAAPQDYMEDHMNACRLAVTAAFCRGMPNYPTEPDTPVYSGDVTVYHALPWGLRDGLRRRVDAGQYVDVTSVMAKKRAALACHKSQKEWLDTSQGLDSYLITMEEMARDVGRRSGRFDYAEGWRRHLHLGFCAEDADPLTEALGDRAFVCEEYEAHLDRS